MKKNSHSFVLFTVTTALSCTAAVAQPAAQPSFIGLGLGANLSFVKNSMELSSGASDQAKNSTEVALMAGYGYALGKDWVGTLGLSLGLKNSDYTPYITSSENNTATAKQHISIHIAPGYRVGNDGLVYGKLAVHQMKVNYVTTTAGIDMTKTHQGTGVGIGYAHALTPSLEFSVEYESVKFDSQNLIQTVTAQPQQGNLNIGLAYKF